MNLTGSARKLKDTAVDIHNLAQKWTKYNNEGSSIVSSVANVKLQNVEKTDDDTDQSQEFPKEKMSLELESLCTELTELIQKMEKLALKFEAIVNMCKGLNELESYQMKQENKEGSKVLFQTWTLEDFESTIQELYSMYKTELQVKKSVLQNICHTEHKNVLMFYVAAWVHQPYIEDRSKLLLESMLIETGHK
ncbi:hypothetical protein KUTeg_012975 [Tegillarca granosa]|uniref:Cyclin-dependent kinase 2-interacting protein n=1 Tax=Tegillarca granosa TaxID=220873 RepID=A0ABQ9EUS0_TEGGR|nr:hypothetical protein KUTeg_012975 [Tegillarca granosa]